MTQPTTASAVRDRLLRAVTEAAHLRPLGRWLSSLDLELTEDGTLLALAPNAFVRQQIQKRYFSAFEDLVRQCLGPQTRLALRIKERPAQEPLPQPDQKSLARQPTPRLCSLLHPHYTFQNFIVGPSNRLAHEACLHVLAAPGRTFNPLFIHGASGLGKTHLLQATCRAYLERDPAFRVLYLSSEEFLNRFIAALDQNRLSAFRRELRQLDCLIIDDIHFLARKKRMQEEFFHTFNALYDQQRQLILSSDASPSDLSNFEERLISRFQWGLQAPIDPPTPAMQLSILRLHATRHALELPPEVARFVADRCRRNIRELEGAVTRLAAAAKLLGRKVDLALAVEALGNSEGDAPRAFRDRLLQAVSREFGVNPQLLRSGSRSGTATVARHAAMFLAKEATGASLREIASWFGRRHHTTVLHGIEKMRAQLPGDAALRARIRRVADVLGIAVKLCGD